METMDLSNEYLNALAKQFIFISSFLGGFSAALLGTVIVSEIKTKYSKIMVVSSALAAMCFVVTIFGMTTVLFQTIEGYPLPIDSSKLAMLRITTGITMFLGLISFMVCIASSGWLISKNIGRFTTAIGIIAFVLIAWMS